MLWPSQVPEGNGKRDARQGKTKRTTGETPARRGRAPGGMQRAQRPTRAPGNGKRNARRNERAPREVARMSDERRQQIVDAARQLYEEQGLSATTVKDISETLRRGAVAVLPLLPQQAGGHLRRHRRFRERLHRVAAVLERAPHPPAISKAAWRAWSPSCAWASSSTPASAARSTRTRTRRCTWSSSTAWPTAWQPTSWKTTVQDYAQNHPVDIDHVYETFYILIMGICGYVRTHRDAPDEVLRDIIAQTLHMERETNRKPVQTG